MKVLKWVGVAVVVVFLAMQLVRCEKTNPPTNPEESLFAVLDAPPEVGGILKRACKDCHSHDTVWPWYSNVAPMMWTVRNHVKAGRHHLNFSQWGKIEVKKQAELLEKMSEEVKEREMPLSSYLRMHPQAKLSRQEIDTLCQWAEKQGQRLAGASETPSGGEELNEEQRESDE